MASCEKCWRDAHGRADVYRKLLKERALAGHECTPEQQAGEGSECGECHRLTIHMYVNVCMACGTVPAIHKPESMNHRILGKGEIIQVGDETDRCADPWRDEPKWEPAGNIGEPAPDPQYPAHRIYRRPLKETP